MSGSTTRVAWKRAVLAGPGETQTGVASALYRKTFWPSLARAVISNGSEPEMTDDTVATPDGPQPVASGP